MRIINKVVQLSKVRYYETHLSLVNALIPRKMTPKEIEVVSRFMSLDGSIADIDRFGTSAKKIIKEQLGLSDGGLGNYMKSLKDKGFLVVKEGRTLIHPILENDPTEQAYQFKLINTEI